MKNQSISIMICHECARRGEERPPVALCRSCLVGLCAEHLARSEADGGGLPRFGCRHLPNAEHRTSRPFQIGSTLEALFR